MQENEIIDNIKKEAERIKEDSIYSSIGKTKRLYKIFRF